jgi:hypothetical protein
LVKAGVELRANFRREAGDFADASHSGVSFFGASPVAGDASRGEGFWFSFGDMVA